MAEVNCIQLINKLNKSARQYSLSPLAQLIFLRIWERHNLNRWQDEWVQYTDADLIHDTQAESRFKLYRAKKELESAQLLSQLPHKGRTTFYTLLALESQGFEGDERTTSRTTSAQNSHQNRTTDPVPSYISIKDKKIKDKDKDIYTPYIPLKGESEGEEKKKVKKANKPVTFDGLVEDEKLRTALNEFAKFRKEVRKPLTETQLPRLLKKLQGLAPDTETQIAILEQSISCGWQGIFPLKGDKECGANVSSGSKSHAKSRIGETAGEGEKFVGDFMARLKQRYAERGVTISG